MEESPFSKIFYNTIDKLSQANDLEKLVPDLSDYLLNEMKCMKDRSFNQDYLEFFFYGLAALSDYWILNKLVQDKYISNESILSYSVEVKMFSTAESGSKLVINVRHLLEKDDQMALILLEIYLKILTIVGTQDKLLIHAITAKVYPKQLSIADPFSCKTTIRMQNSLIRLVGMRSILASSLAGYLLISTCAWKYGTYELKYSLLEQKGISLQSLDA